MHTKILFACIISLLLFCTYSWCSRKNEHYTPLEPGAASVHPPAPLLRSQVMNCYKCGRKKDV